MATIKYVFFFITLSALLGAHHARHLHDITIHEIFDRLSTFQAAHVIEMVTGRGKPPRPPGAPPQGQKTSNPNSKVTSLEELTEFLTSLPEAKPKPAPSQGQTTYGVDNTKSNSGTPSTEDLADILATKPTTSIMDKITYGRFDQSVPTPPTPADPTRPMLSESLCVDGGSACTGLSTSFTHDDKIVYQMKIQRPFPIISLFTS